MKIKLQTNNSDRKVVTKNVTDLITLTGTLRSNCSIVDPVIQVEAINNSIAASCNYATIEDFGRYYFVNDIIFTGKLYEIHMHCDVLSSFQTPLKSLSAVVARQENKYNLYLQDGLFRTYQNPYISIVPFSSGFTGQYFVFSVSG